MGQLLHLLQGSAHVFYARPACVLSQVARATLEARLSEDERGRLARFVSQADAELYLVAHALTRSLLARYLGCTPQALTFDSGERGRPELGGPERDSGLRFNLSHTRGLAACGISLGAAIGVDVEHLSRRVELEAVGKRVLSTRERAGLAALSGDAQRSRFFDLWTLKEAYVKATGKGLASPLTGVTFSPEACDPVAVSFEPPDADRPQDWCMRRLGLPPEHRLAVALQLPEARLCWQELDGTFFAR